MARPRPPQHSTTRTPRRNEQRISPTRQRQTAPSTPKRNASPPDRRLDLYGPPWGGPWPADLCAYPPCQREDGWISESHKPPPTGRHHAEAIPASDWKQLHDLLEDQ